MEVDASCWRYRVMEVLPLQIKGFKIGFLFDVFYESFGLSQESEPNIPVKLSLYHTIILALMADEKRWSLSGQVLILFKWY